MAIRDVIANQSGIVNENGNIMQQIRQANDRFRGAPAKRSIRWEHGPPLIRPLGPDSPNVAALITRRAPESGAPGRSGDFGCPAADFLAKVSVTGPSVV